MGGRNEWDRAGGEKCQKAHFLREGHSSKMLPAGDRTPPVSVFAKSADALASLLVSWVDTQSKVLLFDGTERSSTHTGDEQSSQLCSHERTG